jgi:hypothetical protein
MTMIQTLDQTIGLEKRVVIALDAMRKQRNIADYSGDAVTPSLLEECVAHAEELQREVTKWLRAKKPELMAR